MAKRTKKVTDNWRWFKFDWVDYEPPTEHLTTQQHGAYFLLIKHYMKAGKPLTPSHMAGIAKATREEWDTHLWPVLQEFFHLGQDGLYRNKRCDYEIEDRVEISAEKATAAAASHTPEAERARAEKRAQKRLSDAAAADPEPVCKVSAYADTGTGTDKDSAPSEHPAPTAPAAASKQMDSLFPDPPIPTKPQSPFDRMKAEVFPLLASLLDKDLGSPEDRAVIGKVLSKFWAQSEKSPEIIVAAVRFVFDGNDSGDMDRETVSPVGRITAQISAACAKPRLVVNNDPTDLWGIDAWCASLSDALPTEEADRHKGAWRLNGTVLDAFAARLCKAAKLPRSWRGDLTAAADWARAKVNRDHAVEAVTARAEWDGYKPAQVASLAMFSTFVMGRRAA